MSADTFTVIPEMLDETEMFRLEVFEGKQSVSHVLHDTEYEAHSEGESWGADRVNIDGTPYTGEIPEPDEESYQAVCGSWDCRAPECRPR